MLVIVNSRSARAAFAIGIAATSAGARVELEPSIQEFGSRLYRDPEALGLFWQEGWANAVQIAHELRVADVRNILFAVVDLAEYDETRSAVARGRILNAGADDAQTWPVDPEEIAARLIALARRTRSPDDLIPIPPNGQFDPGNQTVVAGGLSVHLTGQESRLLHVLVTRPGACISKASCVAALYGGRDEPHQKIIDVFVCKLRRKLAEVTGGLDVIETVWGQGFRFVEEGRRPVIDDARRRLAG